MAAQQCSRIALVQEWPKVLTMTSDHISATITYVMWPEERLQNIRVVQKVQLSNIISNFLYLTHINTRNWPTCFDRD